MSRLDIVTRKIAIGRLEAAESQYGVVQHYNVHRSSISCLWQKYLKIRASYDRPQNGRTRITTANEDRYVLFSIYETGQLSTSPVSSSEITVGTEKGQRVPQVQIQRLI